jgi:hypothetical protein
MEHELSVDKLLVTGTMGEAAAKGLMGFDGRCRLALNWNARGPFGVGPVAIDGVMSRQWRPDRHAGAAARRISRRNSASSAPGPWLTDAA